MDKLTRRELMARFVGAAALTATTGSYVNLAMGAEPRKDAKPGTKVKFALKGGGSVQLTNTGKDKWTATVIDGRKRINNPTGLLLLADGKVIGVEKGQLKLGKFGNRNPGADTVFTETVFTEFNQSGSARGRLPLVQQPVLSRQLKDLKGLRSIQITPKATIDPGKIQVPPRR